MKELSSLCGERSIIVLALANVDIFSPESSQMSCPLEERTLPGLLATIASVHELRRLRAMFAKTMASEPAFTELFRSGTLRFRVETPEEEAEARAAAQMAAKKAKRKASAAAEAMKRAEAAREETARSERRAALMRENEAARAVMRAGTKHNAGIEKRECMGETGPSKLCNLSTTVKLDANLLRNLKFASILEQAKSTGGGLEMKVAPDRVPLAGELEFCLDSLQF